MNSRVLSGWVLLLFMALPGTPLLQAENYASPTSCSWLDDHHIWIWNSGRGTASVMETTTGNVTNSEHLSTPPLPMGWDGFSPRWARDRGQHAIAAVTPWQSQAILSEQNQTATIAIPPRATALTFIPQGKAASLKLLIGFDPPGTAYRFVQLFTPTGELFPKIEIPHSSNLRGLATNASGDVAVVTHLIPKFNLSSTQIAQGWVFTNAISWITLGQSPQVVTLPLDTRTRGSANPEGIAWESQSDRIFVALGGLDSVCVLDAKQLRKIVAERLLQKRTDEIDLQITRKYLVDRIDVGSNPVSLALSPDGKHLSVTNRLDDSLSLIDTQSLAVEKTVQLSEIPADEIRLGERLFHSGKLSLTGQFSCASCHPDGHTDGLNWDLPADGFNNFFNTRSLLGAAGNTPYGWLGETANLDSRFNGTLKRLFQHPPTNDESIALLDYLKKLNYPSFKRVTNQTEEQKTAINKGRALFEGKAGCNECHYGRRLTDGETHSVGIGEGGTLFDTPSLRHIRETAPYLHDGRAATLIEIFTRHNPRKMHGNAAELNGDELNDLIAYLESL